MNDGDADKFERAIVELKSKRPFEPFRIVTAKGVKLLVADPDRLMVVPGGAVRVFERSGHLHTLKMGDIIALEELKVKYTA